MLRNILESIEALVALEQFGTASEAAARLGITQSAVSKRIHSLQKAVGFRLVEPHGRRLRLTAEAVGFLERARPVVADMRGLADPLRAGGISTFSLALSDSIAASWGPRIVAEALQRLHNCRIDLHAHRSVLLVESVRLGRYHIGLSTDSLTTRDLLHYPVIDEPVVLINSGLNSRRSKNASLITIEPGSATWRAIEPLLRVHAPALLSRQIIPVESFSAALQMVKAGFGDAIAPLGLALEMKLDRRGFRILPGVTRRVSLLTRKTISNLVTFGQLREAIVHAVRRYFRRHAQSDLQESLSDLKEHRLP